MQFYEFEPENRYAPANVAGANPDSRIQLDVIVPQKLLGAPEEARTMVGKATEAVRSVLGPGLLRAHLNAGSPEQADEVLAIAYGPGRHTATWLPE